MSDDELSRLVFQYLEARDEDNRITKRRDAIRKALLPLLEDVGGEYIDEIAGVRIFIDHTPRYEYDPTKLHRLVEEGVMLETDFAACLKTVVDKDAVKDWIDRGIVTDRQVARSGAREQTKSIETLKVERL